MSSKKAYELATQLFNLKEDAEEFFEPFLDLWKGIELKSTPYFRKQDAERHFTLTDIHASQLGTKLIFDSEPWEETWSYGGHETHYGHTLSIPLEFFDNPEKYEEDAQDIVNSRISQAKQAELDLKRRAIEDLEAELAEAHRDLEESEKAAKL